MANGGKQYSGWKETPHRRETSKLVHVRARCYVAASNRREDKKPTNARPSLSWDSSRGGETGTAWHSCPKNLNCPPHVPTIVFVLTAGVALLVKINPSSIRLKNRFSFPRVVFDLSREVNLLRGYTCVIRDVFWDFLPIDEEERKDVRTCQNLTFTAGRNNDNSFFFFWARGNNEFCSTCSCISFMYLSIHLNL